MQIRSIETGELLTSPAMRNQQAAANALEAIVKAEFRAMDLYVADTDRYAIDDQGEVILQDGFAGTAHMNPIIYHLTGHGISQRHRTLIAAIHELRTGESA